MSAKTKKAVLSEFRRQEILRAARTVFARRGFAGGTVDDIAAEVGLAKGTIYLYFQSKKEIYRALLGQNMDALKKDNIERIDRAPGLREKIRAFLLARLENAETQRDLFQIMDSESAGLSLTRRQYRDWLKEPVLRLAAAMQEAAARGEIRTLPAEKAAWAVADLSRGAIQRRLLAPQPATLDQDIAFLLDFIWDALTGS